MTLRTAILSVVVQLKDDGNVYLSTTGTNSNSTVWIRNATDSTMLKYDIQTLLNQCLGSIGISG